MQCLTNNFFGLKCKCEIFFILLKNVVRKPLNSPWLLSLIFSSLLQEFCPLFCKNCILSIKFMFKIITTHGW